MGIPIELGLTLRYALNKDYDNLLATMERVGFIQKGEQVSVREIDDMLRQYVEPVEVEVFHYTRKWLQRMTAMNMDRLGARRSRPPDRWTSRPSWRSRMRVIASNVAISCQLDAYVPVRALAAELVPGFADEAA